MADDILDIFSAIPQRAIAAILSEIIENKSFRLKVKGREGYLVYRNGFYLFQPFDLIDMRIPLPLRIAALPVKRDSYDFAKIMEERRAVIEAAVAPEEAPRTEEEEVEGEETATAAKGPAAKGPAAKGRIPYWEALKAWMASVEDGSFSEEAMPYVKAVPAKHKDTVDHIGIPAAVRDETKRRYPTSDEGRRELFRYGMILWMYEYMTAPKPPAWLTEYSADDLSEEKKATYRKAFAQAVLEFFWDTNLNPNEQQYLVRFGDEKDKFIGREQKVQKGSTEAFRYIDPLTGKLFYVCATGRCSDAVTRVFEQDASDPINTVKANTTTTGAPYGFMVPEAKKAVIVFKTNLAPPAGTAAPDEGSKCSNISTIPVHTRMLRDIRTILERQGYTKLFLYDRLLDEDEIRRKEAKEIKKAKDEKKEVPKRTVPEREHLTRNLITATRPCTVKELLLRWLDVLESEKRGLRYFFRPISALKSGHKGRIAKD